MPASVASRQSSLKVSLCQHRMCKTRDKKEEKKRHKTKMLKIQTKMALLKATTKTLWQTSAAAQETNLSFKHLLLVHWMITKMKRKPILCKAYPKKTCCTAICWNQMRTSIWTLINLLFLLRKHLNSPLLTLKLVVANRIQTNRLKWFVILIRRQLSSSPTKKIDTSVSNVLFPQRNCCILIKATKQKWNISNKSRTLPLRLSSQTNQTYILWESGNIKLEHVWWK